MHFEKQERGEKNYSLSPFLPLLSQCFLSLHRMQFINAEIPESLSKGPFKHTLVFTQRTVFSVDIYHNRHEFVTQTLYS